MNYGFVGTASDIMAILSIGMPPSINWGILFGLGSLTLFFIPNLIHFVRRPGERFASRNKGIRALEWLGGVTSVCFTVICLSPGGFGFASIPEFFCYLLGSMLLILINWVLWAIYFIKTKQPDQVAKGAPTAVFVTCEKQVAALITLKLALAVMPALMFLLHGITLRYMLLIVCAIVFAIGHISVALENIRSSATRYTAKEK